MHTDRAALWTARLRDLLGLKYGGVEALTQPLAQQLLGLFGGLLVLVFDVSEELRQLKRHDLRASTCGPVIARNEHGAFGERLKLLRCVRRCS